jgi:hypothetical protein
VARLGSARRTARRLDSAAQPCFGDLARRRGSSSSRPPSSLLRRLSLVWLRHPRARARDAARHHARGGYDRDRDGDRRTGGNRREQRRPAVWRRREMQRSYERRRWLRDGRGGGTGWSRRGGSEVAFWVLSPFSFLPAALALASACPSSRPTRGLIANYYFSNYLGDVVIYYLQLLLGEKLR